MHEDARADDGAHAQRGELENPSVRLRLCSPVS